MVIVKQQQQQPVNTYVSKYNYVIMCQKTRSRAGLTLSSAVASNGYFSKCSVPSRSNVHFYRASYASTVLAVIMCPSDRLSVTSRSCTKMAKPRITLTMPYDRPGTLVFWRQKISAKFQRHHPQRGRQIEVG